MSKTITIIQLLNKIDNGEEVPEKIKYCDEIYKYEKKDYLHEYSDWYNKSLLFGVLDKHGNYEINRLLTDTVEIIEEQEKTLQDILNDYSTTINDFIEASNEFINKLKEKQ